MSEDIRDIAGSFRGDTSEKYEAYCREHHPEWADVWKKLETDPTVDVELQGPDGPFNPILHILLARSSLRSGTG